MKLNVLVVIGTARICPEEGGTKSVRGKRYCGLNCRFINTHVGSRGKMCDARVLRKSGICRLGQIGTHFLLNVFVISEVLVPTIILEDWLWLYMPWKTKV